jgi:cysteine protease ATG4
MPKNVVDTKSTSPPQSPRKPDGSPVATGKSFSLGGDFMNLIVNGKASVAAAVRKKFTLQDDTDTYVLGRPFNSVGTIAWVNLNVKHIHYFSYRNRIPTPLASGQDHDAGWGCMIRTGQMMLCEALRRALPNDTVANVSAMFCDLPDAPFGLHKMTKVGAENHIKVGHWFNPTCLGYTLKKLVRECPETTNFLSVVMARDGAVRREEITDAMILGRHALVVIPVMLGIDKIAAGYAAATAKIFELPTTMGIVGGKPKMSLYFVGAQGQHVFYLDPHTVQPAYVSPATLFNAAGARGTAQISDLDPCMLLCFLLQSPKDLENWERDLAAKVHPLGEYPMFSVQSRPKKHGSFATVASVEGTPKTGDGASFPAPEASSPSASDAAAAPAAAAPPGDDVDDCAYDSDVEEEVAQVHTAEIEEERRKTADAQNADGLVRDREA